MGYPYSSLFKITKKATCVSDHPKTNKQKGSNPILSCSMFFADNSNFLKSCKNGNFISWPGLTTKLIRKNLTPTIATHFGHLKQERQNLQSTQQLTDQDFSPPSDSPNIETNEMIATITPFIKTKKAFGDLPGKFPITSSRGAQYFLGIYHMIAMLYWYVL